jgi:cellulose 1,4-beta-cellobiosidase
MVAATVLALGAGLVIAAGNSARAAPGGQVTYTAQSWGSGFTASIDITNLGDPVSGWKLTVTFPGDQKITNAWNAAASQSGQTATLT